MHQSIKLVVVLFLVAVLSSCNQGESLQGYYVANQETPNFMSLDVPASIVQVVESELSEDQLEAYKSIDKLNMLAYNKANDEEVYKTELAKVRSILKNEKYEELVRGGNAKDGKFVVKMIGEGETIDELIVFGSSNDKGFAIIRVLGDEMDPAKIMTLGDALNNMDIEDTDGLKSFMNFFK